MMRLINHEGGKVRGEPLQALGATERLHRGHHNRGVVFGSRSFHHANGHGRIHESELVDCLVDEFITVGKDQTPSASLLQQQGEHHGFASARG
jgi:hypothetical protein